MYYRRFKCKCERCRHTCCSKFKIPVSKEEYYKLVTLDCSEELNRMIQNAFIIPELTSDEIFRYIGFNYLGYCPIQKDGLCHLCVQGYEEYQPLICKMYPRSLKKINDDYVGCCSNSCEAIIELLMQEDSINFIEEDIDKDALIKLDISEEDYGLMIQMRNIINENNSINDNIYKICGMINNDFVGEYNCNDNPLDVLLDLLKIFKNSDDDLEMMIEEVINKYKDNHQSYLKDEIEFRNRYPNWDSLFKRIIFNNFLYVNFPFVDDRIDYFKAYKGLCLCYGMMKVLSVRYKDNIVDVISAIFRIVEHTPFYYNVSFLEENVSILLKL